MPDVWWNETGLCKHTTSVAKMLFQYAIGNITSNIISLGSIHVVCLGCLEPSLRGVILIKLVFQTEILLISCAGDLNFLCFGYPVAN